jgi:hypothetical protein
MQFERSRLAVVLSKHHSGIICGTGVSKSAFVWGFAIDFVSILRLEIPSTETPRLRH